VFGPAEARLQLIRQTGVALAVLRPLTTLTAGSAADFVIGAKSRAGPMPEGSLEVLLGGVSLGVGTLESGVSHLHFALPSTAIGDIDLVVRFLPADPWWEASTPLVVRGSVAAKSGWHSWPWGALGLLIAAWFVRAWQRPPARRRPSPKTASPPGRAGLSVLRHDDANVGSFAGEILDAHEGTPIASASLLVRVPAFSGDGVIARASSDDDGRFSLNLSESGSLDGATLSAGSRNHADLERPLPKSGGELRIHLITRRRALIKDLISWSQKEPLTHGTANPTPGQLVNAASRGGREEWGAWAQAVEDAAYGPAPLDASRHTSIVKRRPR
jgi:hypothetical protein